MEENYGCGKPVYPTWIHSFCKELRKEMMNFVETHIYIVCEVPSFCGELKMNLPPLFVNPYASTGMFLQSVPNYKEYTKIILTIAEECTSLFPKIHNASNRATHVHDQQQGQITKWECTQFFTIGLCHERQMHVK